MEYPPDKGGVGRYLEAIVKEVADVEVVRPQFFKFFWPRWLRALAIPFAIHLKQLWISHLLPLGYVALLYKAITGTPYTIFVHGTDIQFANKNSWKRFWAKLILNNAEQIIANSKYTLSLINKSEIRNPKSEIIYPCPTLNQSSGLLTKKPFTILSVGRLVARKGYDKGIEAVMQLKKEFSNLTYTIIGNGPEQGKLEDLVIKNNADSYIKIITNADDQKIKDYYAKSELLLAPGQEIDGDVEGFGLVILEAAQFAIPALATNIGGVGEAIVDGQTGILMPDNNVETIIAAISKLLNDRTLLEKFGKNAQSRVKQEFKMANQVKKIL